MSEVALTYPAARISDQQDVYFGTTVADPYRWMEEVDSAEVKVWVDAENALTRGFLAGVPARDRIHARLMELNDFERFSAPLVENGRFFFRRNSGLENQAVLYWQQGAEGEPRLLLNPNTLRADGTVALDSFSVTADGTKIAYALSEAGSDVQSVRVKVVETGEDLPDRVEWMKFSGISWLADGTGFFYSSFGVPKTEEERAEALKRANFFHKVHFHRLGTAQSEDVIVFERADEKEMTVGAGVSDDGRWLVLYQSKGNNNALAVKDLSQPGWEQASAPLIVIAPEDDATYHFIANEGTRVLLQTNLDAPKGKVMEVELEHPERAAWKTLVPESAHSLESAVTAGDTLILTYLVDAKSEVELRTWTGELKQRLSLPGIGSAGVHGAHRAETETYFTFTNYTTPPTLYRLDLASGSGSVWRQPKLVFDPADYATTQVFATSRDGTRVPLFITHKRGLTLHGNNPTLLYGYGGFGVSLGPAYSSSRLAWLEMGGVYAEAILRGGGEYGEAWHEAGTKTRKQNVFDDFIGCAEYLIENSYTSPRQLAINGGSNGGLLVAACALQRPELFGAVLAQVGVLDMLRFDKFTIGYAWKPDYGSPSENEDEFRAIYKYSPLHNIKAGTVYPPMLILTADHDDRVFPAHSFKFAAALQAAGTSLALIRVETRAGHGGGMPLSKQLDVTADMYGFLVKVLGMAWLGS
jgi:prolyl oligopeptidase